MELTGSTVVVTGASRGIGRAIALRLARAGARVVVHYREQAERARDVARAIETAGGEVLVQQGDVTRYDDMARLVQAARERFGAVDAVVHNAGIFQKKMLTDMEPRDWETMFAVHVFGAFNLLRHAVPVMIERGHGVVVLMASFVPLRPPGPGRTHYAAAKAALMGLARALGLELAPHGIRVVALAPGLVATEMARQGVFAGGPQVRQERLARIPLGRMGEPEEIAHAVQFVLENDFLTAETLVISGGE